MKVPSVAELLRIWSSLPAADREVLLGHSREDLSAADLARLMKVIVALKAVKK
jgi:DNA-directed RNA polymerase specialized sigma24 family protein